MNEFFKKELEIQYFPKLLFATNRLRMKLEKRCKKARDYGVLGESSFWWGAYYEKELSHPENFSPPVEIQWIDPILEWGLFAQRKILKHEFIGEYTGIVHRYRKPSDDFNAYCFEYSIGGVKTPYTIDALEQGNWTRLINHSKNPNLNQVGVWFQNVMHVVLQANREIEKKEELTYDYGESYWKKREKPLE